jgi:hypothetical protein
MNGFSTESGAQEHVNDDAPDEFDLAMDSFASGQTPPADQAAGTEAADPNDTGSESGTPPGSGEEAGVSDQTAGAAPGRTPLRNIAKPMKPSNGILTIG